MIRFACSLRINVIYELQASLDIVESSDDLRILRLNLKIDDIPEASQNPLETIENGWSRST